MARHNGANPPPQNIPDEQIIAMREAGYAISFIAKKAGLAPGTVGWRLRHWGVKPEFPVGHPQRVSDEFYETIRRMYWDENKSTMEIGKALGRNYQTITYHMRRAGIPLRDISEQQRVAWGTGRQPKTPRGFYKARLQKVENEQNDQNNNDNAADSVHS